MGLGVGRFLHKLGFESTTFLFLIQCSNHNAKPHPSSALICLHLQGIKTWMDEDDIQDEPKLRRSMAYGVENSAAVLICMSQSYCDSENCEDGKKPPPHPPLPDSLCNMRHNYSPVKTAIIIISYNYYVQSTHIPRYYHPETTLKCMISSTCAASTGGMKGIYLLQ